MDYATVPQARTLDSVDRWGFTVFADPWEIGRALTGERGREEGLDPHVRH